MSSARDRPHRQKTSDIWNNKGISLLFPFYFYNHIPHRDCRPYSNLSDRYLSYSLQCYLIKKDSLLMLQDHDHSFMFLLQRTLVEDGFNPQYEINHIKWLCDIIICTGRKDRKSTRLNSSHGYLSYAVLCLKKKA